MATTRFMTRSLLTTTRQTLRSAFSRSYTSLSLSKPPPLPSNFFLLRLRPLAAAHFHRLSHTASTTTRSFSTQQTSSSLSDPNPNWSSRPPKETILLDGCDFEHWLVVMEKPETDDVTRDDIIDSYIKTLATVVGSEEEARMKIYSVSTRHYFAFGALVSEELSYKLKELPRVRWVLPDSYLNVREKDYGGEPFINGQAVPYDPKYHEEWVRNSSRANERNRRNDRPRNFDRSRNFERRTGPPPPNSVGPGPNMAAGPPPPPRVNGPPPSGNMQPFQSGPGPNQSGYQNQNPNMTYPSGPGPAPYQNQHYQSGPGPTPYQNQHYQSGPGPAPYQNQPYQSGPGPNQGGGNPYQNPNQNQNY